jgi:hypothetical protein
MMTHPDPVSVPAEVRAWLNRRQLLQLGGGYLGLSLAGLWRAQAALAHGRETAPQQGIDTVPEGGHVGARSPDRALHLPPLRACILLFQYGGPSHLDTFDLKPTAPREIRGEFRPIATSVPGLTVCEHLPRLSRLMHKTAQIRSLHHNNRLHDSASIEILTGRPLQGGDRELFSDLPQFFPSHGGALSYLWRGRRLPVAHAALPFTFHNVVDVPCQGAGFLGTAYNPLWIQANAQRRTYRGESLLLPADLPAGRLAERRALVEALDHHTAADAVGAAQQRRYAERAYQLLQSEALRQALDITREDVRTRDRYGYDPEPATVGEGGGGGNGAELGQGRQMRGQNLLLARRLVEAGVPFVNVYDFKQQGQNWDAHFRVFNQHRTHLLPAFDRGLAALIEDLDARGLLESTLVIALGEFGRTPRINGDGGRDHWPDCYSVLLAGGGVKGGFVYGASDRFGAYPALHPVTPADLAATIFWRFGIDPATEIRDLTGRPYRIAEGEPIRELFEG